MPPGPPNTGSTVVRFALPVTRRRYGASTTNDDGLREYGEAVEVTINAHTWDAPAEVVALLPVGLQTSRTIVGHTVDEVLAGDPVTDTPPDHLVVQGEVFEVRSVARWTGYREFVATRVYGRPVPT